MKASFIRARFVQGFWTRTAAEYRWQPRL